MTSQDYANEYVLVTGKSGETLPITTTRVEADPCMKPNEISKSQKATWYPLEADFLSNHCTRAKTNGYFNDDRYQEIGMEVSQYDVQDASGVIDILWNMPLAYQSYSNIQD
jgi:hypothetical protein